MQINDISCGNIQSAPVFFHSFCPPFTTIVSNVAPFPHSIPPLIDLADIFLQYFHFTKSYEAYPNFKIQANGIKQIYFFY